MDTLIKQDFPALYSTVQIPVPIIIMKLRELGHGSQLFVFQQSHCLLNW